MVSSTPQPYFTPRKDRVPIVLETGWVPGPVRMGRKSRPTGIRSLDRPARSQLLYRLSYPAHDLLIYTIHYFILQYIVLIVENKFYQLLYFYVLLTVHFSNILFRVSNLMQLFIISFYIPLHVSSLTVLIIRRFYCIYTQHLVPYVSLFLGDCSVHRLLED